MSIMSFSSLCHPNQLTPIVYLEAGIIWHLAQTTAWPLAHSTINHAEDLPPPPPLTFCCYPEVLKVGAVSGSGKKHSGFTTLLSMSLQPFVMYCNWKNVVHVAYTLPCSQSRPWQLWLPASAPPTTTHSSQLSRVWHLRMCNIINFRSGSALDPSMTF